MAKHKTSGKLNNLTIPLTDGTAEYIGDGMFVAIQRDETVKGHPVQNVVLTRQDLEAMLARVA